MLKHKGFVKFVHMFMRNIDTKQVINREVIDFAIRHLSQHDLVETKENLKHLLNGSYSDDELVDIWRSCEPQFVYLGKAQRNLIQEAYDAVLTKLANPNSTYSEFTKNAKDDPTYNHDLPVQTL
jgi:hypothetical protein